ncbi:MAG: DUF2157 domain-containing protein [Elusimicrobia bacterium]|nr:DUF2157 domain-containing protein [Elusimicrobiota bacterium]
MKISKKELEKLNKEGLITSQQVENIISYYQNNNDNNKLWKRLFIIAALLIALGIILIIGANWAVIPNFIKVVVDFILFLVLVYADYYFIINNKKNLSEVFLVISFFMVAGTIGLIAQVYNLDGGWLSFARFWMILTIPFVFLSKTYLINILWLLLLFNSFPHSFYIWLHDIYSYFVSDFLPFPKKYNISIFSILVYFLLKFLYSFAIDLYHKFDRKIIITKAFSIIVQITIYYFVLVMALDKNFVNIIFVFSLLAYKMYKAFNLKKEKKFRNYAILTEIYIIYLFVSAYGNLLFTGIGFIAGGILLLVSIYILRKTLSYIKKLEAFN